MIVVFKNFSIRLKLLVAFLFAGTVGIVVTGWQSYWTARNEIKELTFDRLTALRETKKDEIRRYFNDLRNKSLILSEDLMVISAIKEFKEAVRVLPEQTKLTVNDAKKSLQEFYKNQFLPKLNAYAIEPRTLEDLFPTDITTILLQGLYIANNPNPVGKKKEYTKALDGSSYSDLHAKYQTIFSKYHELFGYYDIYFVDIESGYVLFNIAKEIDFATNLLKGPFRNTHLSQLFKDVQETTNRDFVRMVDYDFYDPSYGKPASFIGTPVYDGEKKIGMLAFILPISQINNIMIYGKRWSEIGLGESGETFLVGPDRKMRTVSRFFIENQDIYLETLGKAGVSQATIDRMRVHETTIFLQRIDAIPVREVTKGHTDTAVHIDYRNIPILVSYTPLDIEDVSWGIISKIDAAEAFMPITFLAYRMIIGGILILLFLIIFSLIFVRFFTWPIRKIITSLEGMLEGPVDLTTRLHTTSKDEIGTLAHYFNSLIEKMHSTVKEVMKVHKVIHTTVVDIDQTKKTIEKKNRLINQEITNAITVLVEGQDVFSSVEDTSGKEKRSMQQVIDVVKDIVTTVKNFEGMLKNTYEKVVHTGQEEENITISLRNNILNAKQLMHVLQDDTSSIKRMQQYVSSLAQHIKNINTLPRMMGSSKETMATIFQIIQDMSSKINTFVTAALFVDISKTSDTITEVQKKAFGVLHQELKELLTVTDKNSDELGSQEHQFQEIIGDIKQAVGDIIVGFDAIKQATDHHASVVVDEKGLVKTIIVSQENTVARQEGVFQGYKDVEHVLNKMTCAIQNIHALESNLQDSINNHAAIEKKIEGLIARLKVSIEQGIVHLKACTSLYESIEGETKELSEFINTLGKIEQILSEQLKYFRL